MPEGINVGSYDLSEADTEKMRTAAARATKRIKALREKIAALMEAVRLTEANGIWVGCAADVYRECFLHTFETFDKQLDLFEAYPRELLAYVDAYEGTINEANKLAVAAAEAAEQANWDTSL